jgi:hypothetical protein
MTQGPVKLDFRKWYSIRPRYSTFEHFLVCSASDEIRSAYAQHILNYDFEMCWISPYTEHARKLVIHCMSMCDHILNYDFEMCWISPYTEHARKLVIRCLSMCDN